MTHPSSMGSIGDELIDTRPPCLVELPVVKNAIFPPWPIVAELVWSRISPHSPSDSPALTDIFPDSERDESPV